ncbi:MAG: restriction endonuclease subunit S [Bacteroidales bacterium]|nr:restriction endonuclease subunit S [Bacteroidales bacterium]
MSRCLTVNTLAKRMVHQSQFIEMFGNPMVEEQKYPLKKLGDCCVINPKRSKIALSYTDPVSFVPMPSVNEEGYLQDVSDAEYGSVKKGFTYFENGDVLFAKITPCMENGKGAIAHDLTNGIGMGSTEFHVLRPLKGRSNSYWLLTLTRLPEFRDRAAHNMSGTGGQQRVRADYLENFIIGLPPIEKQIELENICRVADKSKFDGLKSQFIEMFGVAPNHNHRISDYLNLKAGKNISAEEIQSSNNGTLYPCFGGNGLRGYVKDYTHDGNYVLIGRQGALCGNVQRAEGKFFATEHAVVVSPKIDIDLIWLYHALLAMNLNQYARGVAQPGLAVNQLEQISFIVPDINQQKSFSSIANQADKSKYLN